MPTPLNLAEQLFHPQERICSNAPTFEQLTSLPDDDSFRRSTLPFIPYSDWHDGLYIARVFQGTTSGINRLGYSDPQKELGGFIQTLDVYDKSATMDTRQGKKETLVFPVTFPDLLSARLHLMGKISDYFWHGNLALAIDPAFLRGYATFATENLDISTQEPYLPDAALEDALSILKLASLSFIPEAGGNPLKKTSTPRAILPQAITVLNRWVPDLSTAVKHVGQLVESQLSDETKMAALTNQLWADSANSAISQVTRNLLAPYHAALKLMSVYHGLSKGSSIRTFRDFSSSATSLYFNDIFFNSLYANTKIDSSQLLDATEHILQFLRIGKATNGLLLEEAEEDITRISQNVDRIQVPIDPAFPHEFLINESEEDHYLRIKAAFTSST